MNDFITKPVRPQALHNCLANWLPQSDAKEPLTQSVSGLDNSAISEVWGDDIETFTEIGKIFLEELDWRLPGLNSSASNDVEHHAHSLKGAASNIGATELSRLAAELERAAADGLFHRVDELKSRVVSEAETVKTSLKEDYIERVANA